MRPLVTSVEVYGWTEPVLLKVAGINEFISGRIPFSRLLLDLRHENLLAQTAALDLPWAGFISSDPIYQGDKNHVQIIGDQEIVAEGDVVEINPISKKAHVRYRRGDNGNVLFATERCNSTCLMCSQPPRKVDDYWRVEQLKQLISLIDTSEKSLAISGGEPTLLGDGPREVIATAASQLPETHIHVLSNGRLFKDIEFADSFRHLHHDLTWGVPLYGDTFRLHDWTVQSSGAFSETIRGIYALHNAGQRIEIRVVLNKRTVERLPAVGRFIFMNLPFVEHVALMGLEPIGFAKGNHRDLWMDPEDMSAAIEETVGFLNGRSIPVSIYNLPLCVLPRRLWPYARKSISNWKQSYLPECSVCAVKDQCGGFFSWITPKWISRGVRAVEAGEMQCANH